jgi:hypothetical protein
MAGPRRSLLRTSLLATPAERAGITNIFPASSTVAADHTLFEGNGMDYGGGVGSANEVDGDPRPIGPLPDLGADEARSRIFLPLLRGAVAVAPSCRVEWVSQVTK